MFDIHAYVYEWQLTAHNIPIPYLEITSWTQSSCNKLLRFNVKLLRHRYVEIICLFVHVSRVDTLAKYIKTFTVLCPATGM